MDIENKYGTLEMQKHLLVLMEKFDKFCVDNGFNYSLGGGSLLGAVRENGFIPWDDDLDINVDRHTYKKLLKAIVASSDFSVCQELWVNRVRLSEDVRLEDGSRPTLDLFVVDNVPNNSLINSLKLFVIKMLQGMLKEKHDSEKYTVMQKILIYGTCFMGLFFPKRFKLAMYDSVSQWGNGGTTEYVTVYNTLYKYISNRYEADLMQSFIRHKFENIEVSISKGYHNHLMTLYGDYMTPPNAKDRIPQHMHIED